MTEDLSYLFPGNKRDFWHKISNEASKLQEIRLRAGQPILVILEGRESFLNASGNRTDRLAEAQVTTPQELEELLLHICNYSLYAFSDEIRQGFLTVSGGHRVGLAGQVVLEEDGSVRTIKHISYLNIRIAHQIKGAADELLSAVYEKGRLLNTLIISPPGCGKTTLLRDMIRQVSNGTAYCRGLSVSVVDERSEIAGSYLGIPQNEVGMRTDVLDACPKATGMMMLLRSMAPDVIAVDELGCMEEGKALLLAASCGCRILATIHGEGLKDIGQKKLMEELWKQKLFQCFILLGKKDGRCRVEQVYRGEEAYAAFDRSNVDQCGKSGTWTMVSPTVYGKNSNTPPTAEYFGTDHE